MQHFLKIGGKRYGEVRNFKKVRKFASSNLKFRSSKFKFTEILFCNPGPRAGAEQDGERLPEPSAGEGARERVGRGEPIASGKLIGKIKQVKTKTRRKIKKLWDFLSSFFYGATL